MCRVDVGEVSGSEGKAAEPPVKGEGQREMNQPIIQKRFCHKGSKESKSLQNLQTDGQIGQWKKKRNLEKKETDDLVEIGRVGGERGRKETRRGQDIRSGRLGRG